MAPRVLRLARQGAETCQATSQATGQATGQAAGQAAGHATGQAAGQVASGAGRMTLEPFAIAVVAVAVLGSSFVSGIFGMAGGMILLGALLVFMDVAPAMVLLSVIQTLSNG